MMNYGDGRATHLQWTEHARIQQKWAIHFSEMKQLTQGEIGRFSQCQKPHLRLHVSAWCVRMKANVLVCKFNSMRLGAYSSDEQNNQNKECHQGKH
jgi:hypothetical protein